MERALLNFVLREAVSGEYIPPEKPATPPPPKNPRPAPKSQRVGDTQGTPDAAARVDARRPAATPPTASQQRADRLAMTSKYGRRHIRKRGGRMQDDERVRLKRTIMNAEHELPQARQKAAADAPKEAPVKPKTGTLNLPHTNEIKPTAAKAREMRQERQGALGRFSAAVKQKRAAVSAPPPTPGTPPTGSPSPAPTLDRLGDTLKNVQTGFGKFMADPAGTTASFLRNNPRAKFAVGGLALGGALYAGHKLFSRRPQPQQQRIATMESDSTDYVFRQLFG